MKKLFFRGMLLLWLLAGQGCATVSELSVAKLTFKPDALVEKYYTKAMIHEQKGESYKALYLYKTAGALAPDHAYIIDKINRLTRAAREAADLHYQNGLVLLKRNEIKEARREFMITLRHDPYHDDALRKLRDSHENEIFTPHRVAKGETLRKISEKYYKDPSLDFLVAYFNEIKAGDTVPVGKLLRIPAIDRDLHAKSAQRKTGPTIQKTGAEIPTPSQSPQIEYQQADKTDKVDKIDKVDKVDEVVEVDENEILFRQALKLMNEGRLTQAMATLEQVDKSFKNIKETIAELKKRMRGEADIYYKAGVKYFLKEQLEAAISAWNKTLELYPEHPKARDDMNKAQSLLMRLENIKK